MPPSERRARPRRGADADERDDRRPPRAPGDPRADARHAPRGRGPRRRQPLRRRADCGRASSSCPGSDHMPWLGDQDAALDEIEEFLTGVRPHPALDRVLATVLFTDIVGSTELAADLGDRRWRELLEQHNASRPPRARTFPGPRAEHGRRRLPGHVRRPGACSRVCGLDPGRRPRARVPDPVRPPHGELELVGSDIRGIAVHTGARVAALAGAGRGAGLEHRQRPGRRLRPRVRGPWLARAQGRPGEWRLYAVAGA